jgi:hypothetical protein
MLINQNRTPRSVDIIKQQMSDLNKVKASINYSVEFDAATKSMLKSINAHENHLIEELEAAEWLETQSDFEFSLAGSSVVNHALSANILAKFVEQVQKLRLFTSEIASGTPSSRGRFSNELIKESQLLVKCFVPSSFAIHFTYANEYMHKLLDTSNERPGEDYFLSLLSGNPDSCDLNIPPMSTRLKTLYTDFLSFLAENDLTLRTRTKVHPFSVTMTPINAKDRKELFDYNLPEFKEEEISIEGILIMGDIKNNSFKIQADATFFHGNVSIEGAEGLKQFVLGSKVQATLLVTENEDTGRTDYTLLSLNQVI